MREFTVLLVVLTCVFTLPCAVLADDAPPAALAVAPHDEGNIARVLSQCPRSPFPEADEIIVQATSLEQLTESATDEPGATAQEEGDVPVVPWDEAKGHVGKKITAEGLIVRTNNIGHITFLNFVEEWRGTFTVVLFEEAYPDLPGPPQDIFRNKTIRATGVVTLHKGAPQIEVRDARQIEIVKD